MQFASAWKCVVKESYIFLFVCTWSNKMNVLNTLIILCIQYPHMCQKISKYLDIRMHIHIPLFIKCTEVSSKLRNEWLKIHLMIQSNAHFSHLRCSGAKPWFLLVVHSALYLKISLFSRIIGGARFTFIL